MSKPPEREFDRTYKRQPCRVIATGSEKYAALIEFEDGSKKIVRKRALRKVRVSSTK